MSTHPDPPSPTPAPASTRPPKAADFAATRDWPAYFNCMLGKPARETLLRALELFEKEAGRSVGQSPPSRRAVDLGCGEGRDTLELLNRAWTVTALDGHPLAIDLLLRRVPPDQRPRLTTEVVGFDRARWPECDLLNSSFALPFCPPDQFAALWTRVRDSIRRGGRFAGQLFGDRDSWAVLPDRTHHPRSALDALFQGFILEELREEEKLDTDCAGTPKHWHLYHIVARRV